MPNMLKHKKRRNASMNNNSINEDFDLNRFKEAMKKEMQNDKYKKRQTRVLTNKTYEESYSNYIREVFNSNVIMIINRLCIESQSCPDDIRNNYPLHSLLIKTSKELLMNQLELVYLSLYLDNFGWRNNSFDIMDNFLIVALSVKKYLNSNTDVIELYLSEEYPDLIAKFNLWLRQQRDLNANLVISPRVVNERYNILIKPYNTFCKNNFVDYNESVDKILQMSLPDNESNRMQNGNGEKGNQDVDMIIEERSKENNDIDCAVGNQKKGLSKYKKEKLVNKKNNKDEDEDEEEDDDDNEDEDDDDEDDEEEDDSESSNTNQQANINHNSGFKDNDGNQNNKLIETKRLEEITKKEQEENNNNIEEISMFGANDNNANENNTFSVGHFEVIKPDKTIVQEVKPSPFKVNQNFRSTAFVPFKAIINNSNTTSNENAKNKPKLFNVKEIFIAPPKTKSIFNLNLNSINK